MKKLDRYFSIGYRVLAVVLYISVLFNLYNVNKEISVGLLACGLICSVLAKLEDQNKNNPDEKKLDE